MDAAKPRYRRRRRRSTACNPRSELTGREARGIVVMTGSKPAIIQLAHFGTERFGAGRLPSLKF
jgi:hypothetical protein